MSAGFCPYRFHPRVRPDGSAPSLITHVRAFVIGSKKLEESSGGGADCHSQVRVCASEHRSDAWLGLVGWLWRRAMLCLWCSQASVVGAASVPAVLTWWCAGRPCCHPLRQASGHWIVDTPIANPMSVYQAYKTSRRSWGINALGTVIVEVELQVWCAALHTGTQLRACGASHKRSCGAVLCCSERHGGCGDQHRRGASRVHC